MLRRNVAGQHLYFMLLNSSGVAVTDATVTARRGIDGAAQAACTGTVTDMGNGQYRMNLSQADTDGNSIGYLFTASGAVPVHIGVLLTAADPTDAAGYGIARLDAAVSTRSTYAGADTSGTTTLLGRLTAPRAALLDNMDATVSSRMATYTQPTGFLAATFPGGTIASTNNITGGTITTVSTPPGDSSGVTTLLSRLTNGRANNLDNLNTDLAIGFAANQIEHDATQTAIAGLGGATDSPGVTTLLSRITPTRATNLDNLDATITSRSTYAGTDTAGTTTLLSRLTGPRATLLDNLDATVSSRSTYNGADTAGVTTLLGRLTAPRAAALDLLDVAISTRMASGAVALDAAGREAIADAILARNIAGGANGGRTVGQAHAFVRNRWQIVDTTLTVYANDDTTALWTGEIVPGPGGVITGMDPT